MKTEKTVSLLDVPGQWQQSGLRTLLLLLSVTILFALPARAADPGEIWSAVRSGDHVVLMRHALAPGIGDPAGFAVSDCATQRNLSASGREQARWVGELFRAKGIKSASVYSSQWCRCLETARLLGLGPVEELPIINSFFQDFQREEQQTRQLTEWLRKQDLSKPLLLVTHQVNITALTGVYPSSGELVVLRREEGGNWALIGTLETIEKNI